jgi:hypothetical protein
MAKYCLAFETMKLIILNLNPEFRQFAKSSKASVSHSEIQSDESSQDENEADDPDESPTQNNEMNKKDLAELVQNKISATIFNQIWLNIN